VEQASSKPAIEHQSWNQSTNGADERSSNGRTWMPSRRARSEQETTTTSESVCGGGEGGELGFCERAWPTMADVHVRLNRACVRLHVLARPGRAYTMGRVCSPSTARTTCRPSTGTPSTGSGQAMPGFEHAGSWAARWVSPCGHV
jgi:hypothetical protein